MMRTNIKQNVSKYMALFAKAHIALFILLLYSQSIGAEYQFKDKPNKMGQFDISCEGLLFPENSAFNSAIIQISKLYESSDGAMVNPKEELRKKFQEHGINGYKGYLNKIKILIEEAKMAQKEGETLSRERDYTIKDIGINAGRKFVSQESARRKGAKLISDSKSYMEEAQEMTDILNKYVSSRKIGRLTREWKSAKGESVYGTVLELKDGKITFVNDKTKFFTFEESILEKNDIAFLHDNIILLDVLDFPDLSSQSENAAEILERTQKAYEKGNAYAAYVLALAYKNGYGVETNWDTALKYMEKAAQNGIAEAQKSMGDYNYSNWENTNILLSQNKDATKAAKALEWYEKSAKNGNRPAMIMCAKILFPEDINKAHEWAIRAYNFKYEDENGCEMLAVSLLGDIEMRRGNIPQAVKWYEMAAKRRNLYAILKLADYYCSKGNFHKFLTYSSIADKMGNLNGNLNLAEAMYWGWGTERNLLVAAERIAGIKLVGKDNRELSYKHAFYSSIYIGFDYRDIKFKHIATERQRNNAIKVLKLIRGKYAPIAAKAAEMLENGITDWQELKKYSIFTAKLMF